MTSWGLGFGPQCKQMSCDRLIDWMREACDLMTSQQISNWFFTSHVSMRSAMFMHIHC